MKISNWLFGKKYLEMSNDELKHVHKVSGIGAIFVLLLCSIPTFISPFLSSFTAIFPVAFSILAIGMASSTLYIMDMLEIRMELRFREVLADEHNGKPERSIQ